MKYIISREAINDLDGIWLYTSKKWSVKQADRYLNWIIDGVEYLTNNPEAGKDYSNIKEGYFRFRVKSHFIFYKINSHKEAIEIIRILHQRMDIDSRLGE